MRRQYIIPAASYSVGCGAPGSSVATPSRLLSWAFRRASGSIVEYFSASDEEIFAACRAAAIHDKILTFADRYDTQVGEQERSAATDSDRPSLLEGSPHFILDEATSAVDTNTESEIQTALDVLRSRRTTFVISHRLSTIVEADQILIVDEGRIVERGTHQELLGKEGRYKSLWTKQIGGGLERKQDCRGLVRG